MFRRSLLTAFLAINIINLLPFRAKLLKYKTKQNYFNCLHLSTENTVTYMSLCSILANNATLREKLTQKNWTYLEHKTIILSQENLGLAWSIGIKFMWHFLILLH